MKADNTSDKTLAIHEAGHAFVAAILGQRFNFVSIDCFVRSMENGEKKMIRAGLCHTGYPKLPTPHKEFLLCLSGPRAQIEFAPESLPPEELVKVRDTIIHFDPSKPRETPHFAHLGWEPDLLLIADHLCSPGGRQSVRSETFLESAIRADRNVKILFSDEEVRKDFQVVSSKVLSERRINEESILQMIKELPSVKSGKAIQLLER